MSRILVDTSVWVEFFRGSDSAAAEELGELLRRGLVCIHGLISAELLSGTRTDSQYRSLRASLAALPSLDDPIDLWNTVARARWRLARRGYQAAVADLVVAVAASRHHRTLLTLDKAFAHIRTVLPLRLLKPQPH